MTSSMRLLEKIELVRGEDITPTTNPNQHGHVLSPCSAPHSKRVWHAWNAAYQLKGICHLNGHTYIRRLDLSCT